MEYVLISGIDKTIQDIILKYNIRVHRQQLIGDGMASIRAFCNDEQINKLKDADCQVDILNNNAVIDLELEYYLTSNNLKDNPLYVTIEFKGNFSEMQELGFQTNDRSGNIRSGSISAIDIPCIVKHPNLVRLDKQRRKILLLNDSIPEIKADQVWHRSGDNFGGYAGKDVIIGIVDTGIDFTHSNFKHPDGKTRILKIWDQTLTKIDDESVPLSITDPVVIEPNEDTGDVEEKKLGYGVEYDADWINNKTAKVRTRDGHGHGTHVAGIATGNGSHNGRCHGVYTYIGVAPDADLIVVRKWGLSDESGTPPSENNLMIDAISYIVQEARKLKKPVVVNLSIATGKITPDATGNTGESKLMDSLLKRLTADLGTNADARSASLVFGAGNFGEYKYHASAIVPANNASIIKLKLIIKNDGFPPQITRGKMRSLVILYQGTGLEIKITSPQKDMLGSTTDDSIIDFRSTSIINHTANGAGKVLMAFSPTRVNIFLDPEGDDGTNVEGDWFIEFRSPGAQPIPIHAYCMFVGYADFPTIHFEGDHVNPVGTLSEEASSREPIAVGSYNGPYLHFQPFDLSAFSSRGPTIDNLFNATPDRTKPEIVAPGKSITSAARVDERRDICDYILLKRCFCDWCEDFYTNRDGTSMAAPHVTGTVALMMQKNNKIPHTMIRKHLMDGASPKPSGTDPGEDAGWGAGRLNAEGAMAQVPEITPPVVTPFVEVERDGLFQMLQRIFNTPFGLDLKKLSQQMFNEVRFLINSNKRVATVWHRAKGPQWLRTAFVISENPVLPIPLDMQGAALEDGVGKMKTILQHYGSEQLKQFLDKYTSEIELFRSGKSLVEIVYQLDEQPAFVTMKG